MLANKSENPKYQNPFGISTEDGTFSVPLTGMHFDIRANCGIMKLQILQEYANRSESALSCNYIFPLNKHMALSELNIKNGESVISVESYRDKKNTNKSEENNRYINNIYNKLRYIEGENDILSLSIGIVNPGEILNINLRIIAPISVCNDQYYIRIPPYYMPESSLCAAQLPLGWTLSLQITSPRRPILRVTSALCSEKLIVTYNENHTQAFGNIILGNCTHTDILLYFVIQDMLRPVLLFQWSEQLQEFAAIFSIYPSSKGLNNVYYKGNSTCNYVDTTSTQSTSPKEYIFLLDTSFAMEGSKIMISKDICRKFLENLPEDSYFNIIIFGSGFRKMFPISVLNSKYTRDRSLKKLSKIRGNMGEPELLDVLRSIISDKIADLEERINICISSIGNIQQQEEVLREIQINNKEYRINTVGIGIRANKYFILTAAKYGRGIPQFLTTNVSDIHIDYLFTENISGNIQIPEISAEIPTQNPQILNWGLGESNLLHQYPDINKNPKNICISEPFKVLAIFDKNIADKFSIEYSGIDYKDGKVKVFLQNFNRSDILIEGQGLFKIIAKYLINNNTTLNIEEKEDLGIKYSGEGISWLETYAGKVIQDNIPLTLLKRDYEIQNCDSSDDSDLDYDSGELYGGNYDKERSLSLDKSYVDTSTDQILYIYIYIYIYIVQDLL